MKITGLGGYNHGSAADAKRRILAFFDQHLRVGAAVATGRDRVAGPITAAITTSGPLMLWHNTKGPEVVISLCS